MSILMGAAILMGVLEVAVVLMIVWAGLSQGSSRSRQYTLPVHRPQQQPVYQPPPCPPSPSQSYRPSPYTPLLHQPEQHRPVYQPPPRPPPPSQSYRPSPYTPPVHHPEQHQPVSQPPPHRPPPSQSYQSSPYTPPVRQPEQHQPVYRPPPRPPLPSQSYQSSPYTPPVHQPEQHQPVYQSPPRPPPPSQSYQSSPYTPPVHQLEQHQPVSQPPPHRPPPSQTYQPSPHRPPSPHGPPKHEDDNQQDQPNEYYIGLRARANKEGDEMARCFSESHEAYSRGDRAAAKDLSNQGKDHKQKMEQLNKDASNWIYLENNRDRKPGEIDLHGLYVKEAIAYTDAALKEAKLRGDSEIRLIVGKGSHSEGGEARVRPAIKGLIRKYQLVTEFDPSNSGVLVVELNGCPPIHYDHDLDISHRHGRRRASNIGAEESMETIHP